MADRLSPSDGAPCNILALNPSSYPRGPPMVHHHAQRFQVVHPHCRPPSFKPCLPLPSLQPLFQLEQPEARAWRLPPWVLVLVLVPVLVLVLLLVLVLALVLVRTGMPVRGSPHNLEVGCGLRLPIDDLQQTLGQVVAVYISLSIIKQIIDIYINMYIHIYIYISSYSYIHILYTHPSIRPSARPSGRRAPLRLRGPAARRARRPGL